MFVWFFLPLSLSLAHSLVFFCKTVQMALNELHVYDKRNSELNFRKETFRHGLDAKMGNTHNASLNDSYRDKY